jgi:phosphotransferase system HPr (HPr) family protein
MSTANVITETKVSAAQPATPMLRQTFIMNNPNGLHARPCALLVKTLRPFQCQVTVECRGLRANAASILGLMSLAAACGSKMTFSITGGDAAQAIAALHRLFDTNFEDAYRAAADPARTAPGLLKT